MRIAIIVPKLYMATHCFTYIRARNLAQMGAKVRIFYLNLGEEVEQTQQLLNAARNTGVSDSPYSFPTLASFVKGLFGDGFPLALRLLCKERWNLKTLKSVREILRLGLWKADIVHLEVSFLAIKLYPALKLLGCPVIVSLRGSDIERRPEAMPAWAQWIKESPKENNLFFHCVSNYIFKKALKLGINSDKCRMIYQGINLSDYVLGDEPEAKALKKEMLIIVSRLSDEKGIDVAINALKILKDRGVKMMLSIVGDGPEYQNLKLLTAHLTLGKDVIFYGLKSNDWVRDFLKKNRNKSIYLQPSRFESFGQAILEAMACEVPVIAANVGGVPELINSKTGLLHNPDSPIDLADKISEFQSDFNSAKQKTAAAREQAVNKFTAQKEAENFLSFFESFIGNRACAKR